MKHLIIATSLLLVSASNVGAATDNDVAYVTAVAKESGKMVALCKKELADGNRTAVKDSARKILSIEEENEEYMRAYEAQFNITHSP